MHDIHLPPKPKRNRSRQQRRKGQQQSRQRSKKHRRCNLDTEWKRVRAEYYYMENRVELLTDPAKVNHSKPHGTAKFAGRGNLKKPGVSIHTNSKATTKDGSNALGEAGMRRVVEFVKVPSNARFHTKHGSIPVPGKPRLRRRVRLEPISEAA